MEEVVVEEGGTKGEGPLLELVELPAELVPLCMVAGVVLLG